MTVTDEHDVLSTVELLTWQRAFCIERGSPIAAELLAAVLESDEALALLPSRARRGDFIGLRVMAALHRMAIERRASGLALRFPTLGGIDPFEAPDPDRELARLRAAAVEAMLANPEEIAAGIGRVPQTNETGRARLLRCALAELGTELPVRLIEFGCSAGLNLRADALPGDPTLERGPLPVIVERLGCDLDPVDPLTPEGRTLLSSYIWVDDVERWQRLAHALEVAADIPVSLVKDDAAHFLAGQHVKKGTVTVVWHSAVWFYLDEAHRTAVTAQLERMAASATAEAPLLHAAWERRPGDAATTFDLTCRLWDGSSNGDPILLATGAGHGSPVRRLDRWLRP